MLHAPNRVRPQGRMAPMAVSFVSDDELDDYFSTPDCPDCGSEDVELIGSIQDGMYVGKQYRCNKCGPVWTESVAPKA